MQPLPQPIFDAFERMKTKEKHIELRQIKGHFYVYRQKCQWNKQRKKPVKSTELLGRWNLYTQAPKNPILNHQNI
jgi:hypothetical protein